MKKLKTERFNRSLSTVLFTLFVLAFNPLWSQNNFGTWCVKQCVSMNGECVLEENGAPYIDGTTDNILDLRIFIRPVVIDGIPCIYTRSNYKPKGANYPAKSLWPISVGGLNIYEYIRNILQADEIAYPIRSYIDQNAIVIVDKRMYDFSKTRSFDMGNIRKVLLVEYGKKASLHAYRNLQVQLELNKRGHNLELDGKWGPMTTRAYKEEVRLDFPISLAMSGYGDISMNFVDSDDFLKYYSQTIRRNDVCVQEMCVNTEGELLFKAACGILSFEATTDEQLVLEINHDLVARSFVIKKGQKVTDQDGCVMLRENCFGSRLGNRTVEIDCDDNKISIPMDNRAKLIGKTSSLKL
ncbi:MAG: hypothetical protein HRT61_03370 [Ekhidna sp.]|nr:hypothetical protein [Ekhidna sp.]